MLFDDDPEPAPYPFPTDPATMTEQELTDHLRRWPIRWIPCIRCQIKFEWQIDGVGGRNSFFCSDECTALNAEVRRRALEPVTYDPPDAT